MLLRRSLMLAAAAGASALLTACAASRPPATASGERYFFPPPPHAPRLQFLTSIDRAGAWGSGRQQDSSFAQWIAGEEQGSTAADQLDTPYGVDAHNGQVYVCDVGRGMVHRIDAASGAYSFIGSPDLFKLPSNITIDRRDGTRYVCDTGRRMVLVFDAQDQLVREFGNPDSLEPFDLAIGGEELFITDRAAAEIEVWSRDGSFLRTISRQGAGPDELDWPRGLEVGPDGRVYVTDMGAQPRVKIFDRQGGYQGSIGRPGTLVGSFSTPKGIAIDDHGHVYVSDARHRVVQVFSADDHLLQVISGMGGKAPGIVLPAAVAIDRTSLPAFRKYLDPDFEAEYLLFLVNQRGRNKVSVYAYGRSKSLPAEAYEIQLPPADAQAEPVGGP